jgi:outer membrane receptor protein involved in Fe transport
MNSMKKIKLTLSIITLLCFINQVVIAQMPGGMRGGGQSMNVGHFYGKIVDANGKGVELASVQLIQNKMDTVTKKRKDVIVSGMLTNKKGEFSLENLSVMATYKLKITAIGYKTIEQKAAFEMNMANAKNGDMSSMLNAIDKDLGNIKIEVDAQVMQGVTVSASAPGLVMNIDRKVFNVEKNLTSVGGTAVDVMKNVPSVNVDIDGNVTLRNAAPQIFVDGRPSTLSLDQIPADAIASVEIITNPSAKFDASGGGSGILNIVLKKNRKAGYNGNVRASIDSRARPSGGGDFNIKQNKINFFANANIGMRKSISWVNSDQSNFLPTYEAISSQNNNPTNKGVFGFARMGLDYFLDNRNTITIGGSFVKGQFKSNDVINIDRDTLFTNGNVISDYGNRGTKNIGNFRNIGTTLSFKHNFAKASKELTADVNFNAVKNDNTGDYLSQYYYLNNTAKGLPLYEQTIGGGNTKFLTVQTDYANPITDKMKIEMGVRGAFRKFESFSYNYFKTAINDPFATSLINDYEFSDRVLAGYTTFSQQLKKFTYQFGLRLESSKYDGTLKTTGKKFSNEFPISLFPSAFLTYKLTDKQDLQLNYSRKINRPNFFQLIPFPDISDPLNISIGNPNLVPEFTNLVELGYQYQINKNHSILATAYGRITNDLITRYQYKDKNIDPTKDSIPYNSYINANSASTFGLELTSKDKLAKWWDLTTNLNLFNTTLKAGSIIGGGSNAQFSWFAKINNSFKLPKNFSIQLSGNYQAKTILPSSSGGGGGGRGGMGGMFGGGGGFGQSQSGAQGYIKPNYEVEIAIKKDFLKNNAASLTLQMSDIFRTKVNATHAESAFFIQDNLRRRDPQVLRLNFAWRFGKMDISLFKRKNVKGEMEGMQNATQGMGGQ